MSASTASSGDVFSASLDPQDRVMAQARSRGYAAGWAHGSKAVEAQHSQVRAELEATAQRNNAQAQSALHALAQAINTVNTTQVPAAHEILDAVLDAAIDLATEIIGYEVALSSEPGRDVLRRALLSATDVQVTQIRINPDDAATLTAIDVPENLSIVADSSIRRGDCAVDHPYGRIEHFLGDAVRRVREVLSS